MRKSIITSALLLASLISCNTTTQLSNEELDRISWSAFCKDFGYNEQTDRDNEQAINDYLDAWRGSVSEEEAFAKLGITKATKPCPTSSANPASSPTMPLTDVTAPCSTATLSTQKNLHVQPL